MKNLPLILNGILLLAVGYLFADKFSAKAAPKPTQTEVSETKETPKIVYINADTLLMKYDKFQVIRKEMEAREAREDKALKGRGRSLENDVKALQKEMAALDAEAQQGNMSRIDYEARGQKLIKKQQELAAREQKLVADQQRIAGEIMTEGQKINDELQDEIQEKLKALKNEKGYDYILSYGTGSNVLVADDAYDITETVLAILNAATEVSEK